MRDSATLIRTLLPADPEAAPDDHEYLPSDRVVLRDKRSEGASMGIDDRLKNKAQDIAGRGKEAAGAAMDNDSLKKEGRADQRKAGAKDKIEDVKDKVRNKVDDVL